MSREITSVLFPSSKNYTDEMWEGETPSGTSKWFRHSNGVEYHFKHGEAHLVKGELCACNMTLKKEYRIQIVGSSLILSKITSDFKNNKEIKMDYIKDTISFSGKLFSSNELNIMTKVRQTDSYIVEKVKKFVYDKLKSFCDIQKEKTGYLVPEFKNWYYDNVI